MQSFTNTGKKTALVTGGNRGIGLAIVRQLATLGYDVLLGACNLEAGTKAAHSLAVHLTGPLRLIRALVPGMAA